MLDFVRVICCFGYSLVVVVAVSSLSRSVTRGQLVGSPPFIWSYDHNSLDALISSVIVYSTTYDILEDRRIWMALCGPSCEIVKYF